MIIFCFVLLLVFIVILIFQVVDSQFCDDIVVIVIVCWVGIVSVCIVMCDVDWFVVVLLCKIMLNVLEMMIVVVVFDLLLKSKNLDESKKLQVVVFVEGGKVVVVD